jgi:hypothetical protein
VRFLYLDLEDYADHSRYNSTWTKNVQSVIFAILMCGWLGGMGAAGGTGASGKLLTVEEVGNIMGGMYI